MLRDGGGSPALPGPGNGRTGHEREARMFGGVAAVPPQYRRLQWPVVTHTDRDEMPPVMDCQKFTVGSTDNQEISGLEREPFVLTPELIKIAQSRRCRPPTAVMSATVRPAGRGQAVEPLRSRRRGAAGLSRSASSCSGCRLSSRPADGFRPRSLPRSVSGAHTRGATIKKQQSNRQSGRVESS